MTYFEEFAMRLGIPVTTDAQGRYTGRCKALFFVSNNVLFSLEEETSDVAFEAMVKEQFTKTFPYMQTVTE